MRILISNDDGHLAPGLACLYSHLRQHADVTVVAPDRDRSGASNSLTLTSPLRVKRDANGFLHVDGTPTDCVHLAITGLMSDEPDMVIAGINSGANLGDDVLYSGTVAAATEGRFLGFPAIAVSLVGQQCRHFDTAGRVVNEIIDRLSRHPVQREGMILNVNVPDVPRQRLRGFQITRLGNRHKAEPVVRDVDPGGDEVYWVGPAGAEQDAGPGTDFHAIREGYVSITPIQVDLTRHQSLAELGEWLEKAL